jgi:hypothetical protein
MKAKYLKNEDVVIFHPNGDLILESMYDDIRSPIFIDVIYKMSTKIGSFKKDANRFIRTDEICKNISVLGTLNID